MVNFYCFLDESFYRKVFCLGGIFIEENEIPKTLMNWRQLKKGFGLNELDPIKWSLGGKGEEQEIKSKIKRSLYPDRDWLTTFRSRALIQISQFNLKLVASLHQDVRRVDRSPVDFYLWAFKFLLQRSWWLAKDTEKNIFVIIDKPPETKNFRGSESKICKSFKEAYEKGFQFDGSEIPPLRNSGFFECPLITKNNFSSFIQISDFCVGAIRERAKDLLNNNNNAPSRKFLKSIIELFYKTNEKDIIGKGLVVFPRDQTLHSLITEDIRDILSEAEEDEIPF